jgi:hypothetical protein
MRASFIIASVVFFTTQVAKSQDIYRGTVTDSVTRQPIAFVTVSLQDGKTGTSTDIEGNFSLKVPASYDGYVAFSHVSYQGRIVPLAILRDNPIIFLLPAASVLREFEVTATKEENPAFRIIRGAVAHRKENDPASLKSYEYISYNKFLSTLSAPVEPNDSLIKKIKSKDSVKVKKETGKILKLDSIAKTTHFFLSESVTQTQKINPDNEKETL